MAETDSLIDHVVGDLVESLNSAAPGGGAPVRCLVGWPKPGEGPDAGPLPVLSATLASSVVRVMNPKKVGGTIPADPTDNTIAALYKCGQATIRIQIDAWFESKTERLAYGGILEGAFVCSRPSSGRTGKTLELSDRFGELVRYQQDGAATYDDDDPSGPRLIFPVVARVPYFVRETLPRLRELFAHTEPLPGSWPGLPEETVVLVERTT